MAKLLFLASSTVKSYSQIVGKMVDEKYSTKNIIYIYISIWLISDDNNDPQKSEQKPKYELKKNLDRNRGDNL